MKDALIHPDWEAPKNVHAFTTTREGGVSKGPYRSLNLGDHVGDESDSVHANRRRLRTEYGLPAEPVWLRQVHATRVAEAASVRPGTSADGACARQPNVVCAVLTADCLPILLCNRAGTEVAALHAGWRGLLGGIIEAWVAALRSPASELLAWMGPAIGPRAYEVGAEVRTAFLDQQPSVAEAFVPGRAGRWHMNLYAIARQRLAARGIPAIAGGDFCTATQPDLFFSHRRDGETGRMASLIWFD